MDDRMYYKKAELEEFLEFNYTIQKHKGENSFAQVTPTRADINGHVRNVEDASSVASDMATYDYRKYEKYVSVLRGENYRKDEAYTDTLAMAERCRDDVIDDAFNDFPYIQTVEDIPGQVFANDFVNDSTIVENADSAIGPSVESNSSAESVATNSSSNTVENEIPSLEDVMQN